MGVLKDFDCSKTSRTTVRRAGETKYNIINPGVSYCGSCTNSKCEAFQKRVVCNRGHGQHVVNDDVMSGVLKCPSCASNFPLEFIGLYECSAVATVHSHQEQTTKFEAKGEDLCMLGCRTGIPMFESGLLSITSKGHGSGNCVIC